MFEMTLLEKRVLRAGEFQPAALTKTISLGEDGALKVDASGCAMTDGLAWRMPLDAEEPFSDLAERLGAIPPERAIALGRMNDAVAGDAATVVREADRRAHAPVDRPIIARTREFLHFPPDRPGAVLLDFDRKGMPDHVSARWNALGGRLDFALRHLLPEISLSAVGHVWRASTSSGLIDGATGRRFPDSGGQHLYLGLTRADDARRLLDLLHARAWAEGLGWILAGAAGQALERSVFDVSVASPERLIFEGAPVLIDPVRQDPEGRRPLGQDGDLINFGDLDAVTARQEQAKRTALDAEMRRTESTRRDARAAWSETQAGRVAEASGVPLHKAREIVSKRLDLVLWSSDAVEFDDGRVVPVRDILRDARPFDGLTLPDPIDGFDYGRGKAKLFANADDGRPRINSFAHGGRVFELLWTKDDMLAELDRPSQDTAAFRIRQMQRAARLDGEDREDIARKAAEIDGMPFTSARSGVRSSAEAAAEAETEARRMDERRDAFKEGRVAFDHPFPDQPMLKLIRDLDDALATAPRLDPVMRTPSGSGTLVRVARAGTPGAHMLGDDHAPHQGGLRIEPYDVPSLVLRLQEDVVFLRTEKAKPGAPGKVYEVAATHRTVKFLQSFNPSKAPRIQGISRAPYIRRDGSIAGAGLDRRTGIFVDAPPVFCDACIPRAVSADAAAHAYRHLAEDLFGDALFATPADRAKAVLMLATAVQRRVCGIAPVWIISANQRGTGKTTLADIVFRTAFDSPVPVKPWPVLNTEEVRKTIFSELRAQAPGLCWDNIPSAAKISDPTLEAAATSPIMSDRILGESKVEEVSTRAMFFMTGNHIEAVGDLASRTLTLNLEARSPTPERRDFVRRDVAAYIRTHRAQLVRACLVLLAAWRASPDHRLRHDTRFPEWFDQVAAPIEWAAGLNGVELDVAGDLVQSEQEGPDAAALSTVLHELHAAFGAEPFLLRDAARLFNETVPGQFGDGGLTERAEGLREALMEAAGGAPTEFSSVLISQKFKRLRGRRAFMKLGDEDRVAWLDRDERQVRGARAHPWRIFAS